MAYVKKTQRDGGSPPPAPSPPKKRARTSTGPTDPAKEPGFEEQERALSPDGKASGGGAKARSAKATSVSFRVLEVRHLTAKRAEADIRVSLGGTGEVQTVTVAFAPQADDWDSGGEIADAFEAGGHLAGKGLPKSALEDVYASLVKEGGLAIRDEVRYKDLRKRRTKVGGKAGAPKLTAITAHVSELRTYSAKGRCEADLTVSLAAGDEQAERSATVAYAIDPEDSWGTAAKAWKAFVAGGHLEGYSWSKDPDPEMAVVFAIIEADGDVMRHRRIGGDD